MTVRVLRGGPELPARTGPEGGGMDVHEDLAGLDLRDVEDLDHAYFEAELRDLLPVA